jgi:hypothetical protein
LHIDGTEAPKPEDGEYYRAGFIIYIPPKIFLGDQIRRRAVRHVAYMREIIIAISILVGKSEGYDRRGYP